jgi:hypothetical protein
MSGPQEPKGTARKTVGTEQSTKEGVLSSTRESQARGQRCQRGLEGVVGGLRGRLLATHDCRRALPSHARDGSADTALFRSLTRARAM